MHYATQYAHYSRDTYALGLHEHRYCFKGSDSASAAITAFGGQRDAISWYQDHRYLGSSEACWRMFFNKLTYMTHSCTRMVVDIPEER